MNGTRKRLSALERHNQRRKLLALARVSPITVKDAAAKLGLQDDAARHWIDRAVEDGLLGRMAHEGGGSVPRRYEITERGVDSLAGVSRAWDCGLLLVAWPSPVESPSGPFKAVSVHRAD